MQKLTAPCLTVRNTFIEIVEQDSGNNFSSGIKRSQSEGSLFDNTSNFSGFSSSQNSPIIPYEHSHASSSTEQQTHYHEYSNPIASSEDVSSDCGHPQAFDLDQALLIHESISRECAQGADVRDVLNAKFAAVDIKQYVSRDPATGELLSLGSVLHLVGQCKPCSFMAKNTCHKGESCLFCHFSHSGRDVDKCRRASKKTRMRLRKGHRGDAAGADLAQESQDMEILTGIDRPSQMYRPPYPTRISL